MMFRLLLTTLSLTLLLAIPSLSQVEDTTLIPPEVDSSISLLPAADSVLADTLAQVEDTTLIPSVIDTSIIVLPSGDTVLVDTLTAAVRAMLEFEKQQQLYQKEQVVRKPNFSYFDSLLTYYASPRLDQRSQIDRSFYHSAADYFRSDPSSFTLEHQATPMRSTVQPFGLSGDRLNVVSNRTQLEPFEHIVEPDGLTDLSDIPTVADHSVYILPGATGMLFGGSRATASLVTMPKHPESNSPVSGLVVDQGSFDYNHVRGRYSKIFSDSREIDMSVGYRNADGIEFRRDDDAYHYTGRIFQPLGLNYGLNASGWLYSRQGSFVVQPWRGGAALKRHRADRSAEVSLDRHNSEHSARYAIGYRYLRQSSHINGAYKGRFDKNGWGAFSTGEWIYGSTLFKAELSSFHTEYTDGYEDFVRDQGQASLDIARTSGRLRYALRTSTKYIDGFDLLPGVAAVLTFDSPGIYILLSSGYAQRAPTLYELHLRFQEAVIYGSSLPDYADKGNPRLTKETQMVASGLIELGSPETNVRFSVTGGTIKDAIDWQNARMVGALGVYRLFTPNNENIDFADLALQQKLKLKDFLHLRSGAAYHYVAYETIEEKPYSPDYQLFSGLELHYYWPQKIMDLFAYAEITYMSEYEGYDRQGLGRDLVANIKLSFRIKDFRFHYVIQNVLSSEFEPREFMVNPGRYSYYGFEWNFLD